jgi:hypothetical protein
MNSFECARNSPKGLALGNGMVIAFQLRPSYPSLELWEKRDIN